MKESGEWLNESISAILSWVVREVLSKELNFDLKPNVWAEMAI